MRPDPDLKLLPIRLAYKYVLGSPDFLSFPDPKQPSSDVLPESDTPDSPNFPFKLAAPTTSYYH